MLNGTFKAQISTDGTVTMQLKPGLWGDVSFFNFRDCRALLLRTGVQKCSGHSSFFCRVQWTAVCSFSCLRLQFQLNCLLKFFNSKLTFMNWGLRASDRDECFLRRKMCIHSCESVFTKSQLWNHSCETWCVQSHLWNCSVESQLWNHCWEAEAVKSQLWNCNCISAFRVVKAQLWKHSCDFLGCDTIVVKLQWWNCSGETTVVKLQWWNCSCEITGAKTQLWHPSGETTVVKLQLWNSNCEITVGKVQSWSQLWNVQCAITFVKLQHGITVISQLHGSQIPAPVRYRVSNSHILHGAHFSAPVRYRISKSYILHILIGAPVLVWFPSL